MSNFDLLKGLSNSTCSIETVKKCSEFRVYTINNEGVECSIGIPSDREEEFDLHIQNNGSVEFNHLHENYGAIRIDNGSDK